MNVWLIFTISVLFQFLFPAEFQFVKSVEVAGDRYFSDPMGNVYIIKDNNLRKFGLEHTQVADYTNPFLGNIHSIDVSDPLRILLYFKDHNQVIWVDNYLSEILSPLWLDVLGVDQALLVCSSNQGGFWIFNGLNNQLQYFDVNLQFIHESISLNSLTGPDILPAFMLEKSRKVYLNVPEFGILVFDQFGNYSKTIPVDIPAEFQVTDNNLYYFKDGELYNYDLQTTGITLLELPEENGFLKAELQPDFLYLFRAGEYSVYKIRQ